MIRANPYLPHRSFIVEGFDSADLEKLRSDWGKVPLSVFTLKELDLLGYAPSTLFRINRQHNVKFPVDRENARRQLEVEILNQYAVLECSVTRGHYDCAGHIDSRARSFERLKRMMGNETSFYTCRRLPSERKIDSRKEIPVPIGLSTGRGYSPQCISRITDRLNWVHGLKHAYNKILSLRDIVDKNRTYVEREDRRIKLGVTDQLKDMFGKDISVVLFGSAAENGGDFSDYDFLVVVDSIPERYYRHLAETPLECNGKTVDIVLVKRNIWEKYVVQSPFSLSIVENGILAEGDVEFPPIDRREAVLRSVSRAAGRIRTLHGIALNWSGLNPEELIEKEGLFESLSKIPRYVLRALFELRDLENGQQHHQYPKSELEEILGGMSVDRVPFRRDPQAIKRDLFRIMEDTATVVEGFYNNQWLFDNKEDIKAVNNPSPEFMELLEKEMKREKGLQERWKLAEIK